MEGEDFSKKNGSFNMVSVQTKKDGVDHKEVQMLQTLSSRCTIV